MRDGMNVDAKCRAVNRLTEKYGLEPGALMGGKNIVYPSDKVLFQSFTFGRSAVILADPALVPFCEERLLKEKPGDIFDTPLLTEIDMILREREKRLSSAHLRFLRAAEGWAVKPEGFSYRWFEAGEIPELSPKKGKLGNALNFKDDLIAVAAYENGNLAACAGADDYMDDLWQIGIDTMGEYRGRGLASYLVQILAEEIEARGFVPYYNTWPANIASMRVAVNAGFMPAWLEYFAE